MVREAKKDDANVQTSKDKRTLVTGTTGFAHDAFWRAGVTLGFSKKLLVSDVLNSDVLKN